MLIWPLLLVFFILQSHSSWATPRAESAEVKLVENSSLLFDRVEVNGVKSFQTQMIEDLFEFGPGDELSQKQIQTMQKQLIQFYHSYGYEDVLVSHRILQQISEFSHEKERVLQFQVKEGLPSRIAEVEVAFDVLGRNDWRGIQKKGFGDFKTILMNSVGESLTQERISEGKKLILDKLSSLEYVGSSVKSVEAFPVQNTPLKKLPQGVSESNRWVKIRYQIRLGEKVWFGFQGNSYFTWGYLNSLVDDQKAIGLGSDFVETLRRRIEEEYRLNGFYYVRVDSATAQISGREEQKVTFLISEGPRVSIDAVEFDGAVNFTSEQLRTLFLSKAAPLIQKQIFVEKEIQKAGDLLLEGLKEKGYLSAKLLTFHTVFLEGKKSEPYPSRVRVTLYLHEGEQTRVRNFEISGLQQFTPSEVRSVFHVKEGEALNPFALSEGLEELKHFYRAAGYLDFQILNEGSEDIIVYSKEDRNADIHLKLSEGAQARVSRIEIQGIGKTQLAVIHDQLQFQVKDILTEPKLQDTERNLRKLGIFSSLSLRVQDDPLQKDGKVVLIKVQEADRGVLTWGPGVRTDLGIRVFSQLSYMNLWGNNHTVSFSVNANRRFLNYHFSEIQGQLSYIWPKFASVPHLVFKPSVTGGRTQYFDFAADTLMFALTWEKPLWEQSGLLGSFTYSLESARQFNSNLATDNQTYRIGSITPRLTLDRRDNALSPNSGFFSTTWADFAVPLLGSGSVRGVNGQEYSISYYRMQFRADYHLPLWRKLFWYMSFRTGYEKTNQSVQAGDTSTSLIPLIKQFALGGIGSLRGYRELELNYQSQNIPIQNSLSYVNYRTQIDYAFSDLVRFGVFMDAGNLQIDRYSFGNLYYTTGFGFHVQTPVGPVNLDWGFKLNANPRSLESNFVHFSVGVI